MNVYMQIYFKWEDEFAFLSLFSFVLLAFFCLEFPVMNMPEKEKAVDHKPNQNTSRRRWMYFKSLSQ